MKKILIPLIIISVSIFGCTGDKKEKATRPDIIPIPMNYSMGEGNFTLNRKTDIFISLADNYLKDVAVLLQERIALLTGSEPEINILTGEQPKNSILLRLDGSISIEAGLEGYKLSVERSRIVISAPQPAGIFYGMQTIFQLLPPSAFTAGNSKAGLEDVKWTVPCVEITDKPAFAWRGMHLDVSRHFFPREFILKYIDMIAMHKMNVFHWHLTDDNGWRIQIDKYPLLTEVSAWRADRSDIPWNERAPQRPGEKATYGGFYTKEDIREIVEYARRRFITVVPEIEMPGHTSEVFAAYPQFSCTGERTTVQTGSYWPNEDIFCAGKEETFRFIEDVLDEVIAMFPSPYIHIGGDEADKTAWKKCTDCQSRIRKEGLSGVDELQSYFVKRIERYIKSKGRILIGWDEILEGGLAPDATVMSWRGFEGGIDAARQGHKVVMCPTSYCYFDYYQANPDFQPPAIGGLITLKKVYSFRPKPSELSPEEQKLILGAQGNLWTEYVPEPDHAEYMVLPRMTALAEVLWSPEPLLVWDDFKERLLTQNKRFGAMEANYFKGSGRVDATAVFNKDDIPYAIKLETEKDGTKIYYTLDGYTPDKRSFMYKNPVAITNNVTLKAVAYKGDKQLELPVEYSIKFHKGVGKNVSYNLNYSERYTGGGGYALVDGLRGSLDYNDGFWQGWNGRNADFVISLGDEFYFKNISATFLLDQKRWIFYPEVVNFYVSDDGKNFQKIGSIRHLIDMNDPAAQTNDFTVKISQPLKVKFLRIEAVNIGVCPDWHPYHGEKSWIFLDEVVLN
ncbi:MAG: family 20 glycosylhydrolase [Bacteroidales bacterium]|nr:family 20 glycosylhydrolase [Bacteroidales bacterium]